MKNYYVIAANEVNANKEVYLDFDDHSGGYPFYAQFLYGGKKFSERSEVLRCIDAIKMDFKTKSGSYFNRRIDENSFKIKTIGVLEEENIDMLTETADEYKERKLAELKAKLSDEDMQFILKNMANK